MNRIVTRGLGGAQANGGTLCVTQGYAGPVSGRQREIIRLCGRIVRNLDVSGVIRQREAV
jgi:hypothetical protein